MDIGNGMEIISAQTVVIEDIAINGITVHTAERRWTKGKKMYKAFIFLLGVLSLILVGSIAVMGVFCAVDLVKDLIDDWRE